MDINRPRDNIRDTDPDYFDLLVNALSGLSSIAQLATSWREYRKKDNRNYNAGSEVQIREQLRQIQRSFDDIFHNAREAIRFLDQAYTTSNGGSSIDESRVGWGIKLMLSQSELHSLMGPLAALSNAISSIKVQILNLEVTLAGSGVAGEDKVNFEMAMFTDALNHALFSSKNIGEMRDRVFLLEQRADEFLRDARRQLTLN